MAEVIYTGWVTSSGGVFGLGDLRLPLRTGAKMPGLFKRDLYISHKAKFYPLQLGIKVEKGYKTRSINTTSNLKKEKKPL